MLRLIGLLMVLACLLGMQDLADHRPGGLAAAAHAVRSETPMVSHSAHVGDVPTSLVSHVGAPARAEVVDSYPGDAGMDMTMAMAATCMAILAIGWLALLWLLLDSHVGPVLWLRRRRVRVIARPGPGPGPPPLFALSIQRC